MPNDNAAAWLAVENWIGGTGGGVPNMALALKWAEAETFREPRRGEIDGRQ